jgi:endonuclease/exonuclease/phosphatase family metal-dependent hydrolase
VLDADVVGLQEVAFFDVDGAVVDQPSDLGRLTGRAVRYAAVHAFALLDPDTGRAVGSATWGNALLTRQPVRAGFASGLPPGADDDLVEPAGSDLPLAGVTFAEAPHGTREPRCVVGGRIDDGDRPVDVLVTHLTYAGAGQRRAQADELARLAREASGPVVVLGDLNAPVDAPELATLTETLDDGFAQAGIPTGDARRRSCGPWSIDHILTRGLDVEDCRVDRAAGGASDHLPVVATLRHRSRNRSSSRAT